MISMTEKFIFLFVSSVMKNTCSNPDESSLLDERKKTSRSFFIFSWRVSYPSNDCTHIKKSRQQREACCRERLGIILNNYSPGYELIYLYLPILTYSNGFLFLTEKCKNFFTLFHGGRSSPPWRAHRFAREFISLSSRSYSSNEQKERSKNKNVPSWKFSRTGRETYFSFFQPNKSECIPVPVKRS